MYYHRTTKAKLIDIYSPQEELYQFDSEKQNVNMMVKFYVSVWLVYDAHLFGQIVIQIL